MGGQNMDDALSEAVKELIAVDGLLTVRHRRYNLYLGIFFKRPPEYAADDGRIVDHHYAERPAVILRRTDPGICDDWLH